MHHKLEMFMNVVAAGPYNVKETLSFKRCVLHNSSKCVSSMSCTHHFHFQFSLVFDRTPYIQAHTLFKLPPRVGWVESHKKYRWLVGPTRQDIIYHDDLIHIISCLEDDWEDHLQQTQMGEKSVFFLSRPEERNWETELHMYAYIMACISGFFPYNI